VIWREKKAAGRGERIEGVPKGRENELLLLGLGEGKPLEFGALVAAMEGILVLPSVVYGG
jgi:hypothetical protein